MRPQLRANSFQPPIAAPCVHAFVFKFCVQIVADEKKIIRGESLFGPVDFSSWADFPVFGVSFAQPYILV